MKQKRRIWTLSQFGQRYIQDKSYSMGCGSSRRLRAVTPIPELQPQQPHDKTMVIPTAWMTYSKPVSTNASAQTDDLASRTSLDVQTDLLGWDTRDVETQTPDVDEDDDDSLDRMLEKADRFFLSSSVQPASGKFDQQFSVQCTDASVQTWYHGAEESTQTDPLDNDGEDMDDDDDKDGSFDSIFTDTDLKKDDRRGVADEVGNKVASMQSQTEPVTIARAANTADSAAAGVLYMNELLSPFAHLEKELSSCPFEVRTTDDDENDVLRRRPSKSAVQDGIARLLLDVEDSLTRHAVLDYSLKASLREVGVQTDNDPITDEAPEYAARPPPCKKLEMIPDMAVFEEIDKHALQAPESTKSSLRNLVNYLCAAAENELFKVRAFFRWISNNITYDWKYMDVKMSGEEVLQQGEGVCKDYCKLFGGMCK
ncbi:hypothetical protein JTE90_029371 [Oedothorax gibbosus]|uniref:Transglutaminase-like domain-containing protein n=1 Tax=Oedothorax gibbosus TaxID=931172 RepID=A0AAV6VP83_9ARAC|nr:hypothetical protein JTE90_029371 [Oedothorax gibbosus]